MPRLAGRATLVRYADDLVFIFQQEQDAKPCTEEPDAGNPSGSVGALGSNPRGDPTTDLPSTLICGRASLPGWCDYGQAVAGRITIHDGNLPAIG